MITNCKICSGEAREKLAAKYLMKYDGLLLECKTCNFVWVENPHWLTEAYKNAFTTTDSSLVARPMQNRSKLAKIIHCNANPLGKFLDYGGGTGLFAKMMQDLGYDFFTYDKFSENIFSRDKSVSNLEANEHYELISSFEVFEHLIDPLNITLKLSKLTDLIVFSTELIPNSSTDFPKWSYLGFEHGQHISFYSESSLSKLALQLQMKYWRVDNFLHVLYRNREKIHFPIQNKISTLTSRIIERLNERLFKPETYWTNLQYSYLKNRALYESTQK